MRHQNFEHPPVFHKTTIFYLFANILGGHQYFMILLDFVAADIRVYFQYLLCIWVCANIFAAIVLTLGLILILQIMIIWSIVIIINFVLTL